MAHYTASCISNNWPKTERSAWEVIYEIEDDEDGTDVRRTYLSEKSATGASWVWFDGPHRLRNCTITIKTVTHLRHITE